MRARANFAQLSASACADAAFLAQSSVRARLIAAAIKEIGGDCVIASDDPLGCCMLMMCVRRCVCGGGASAQRPQTRSQTEIQREVCVCWLLTPSVFNICAAWLAVDGGSGGWWCARRAVLLFAPINCALCAHAVRVRIRICVCVWLLFIFNYRAIECDRCDRCRSDRGMSAAPPWCAVCALCAY